MKKFFADFKTFISRGNIVDMAVGVIIGGAFSAIVTALTNKIIMPLINALLALIVGGNNGLENIYTFLREPVRDAVTGEIILEKSIYIDWGAFITAIIDFLLIALVLFCILKAVMKANELLKDVASEATNKEKKAARKQVRAKAKEQGRPYKEVFAEYEQEQAKLKEEEAAKKAEEEKLAAEKEAFENPSEQALLKEIRDLLKANAEKDTKAPAKKVAKTAKAAK